MREIAGAWCILAAGFIVRAALVLPDGPQLLWVAGEGRQRSMPSPHHGQRFSPA